MSSNPFHCDCSLQWLLEYGGLVSDITDITCTPHTVHHGAQPQPLAGVSQLLCQYTQHCFSLCRCCTFLACDCRMKCPHSCTCLHHQVFIISILSNNIFTNLSHGVSTSYNVLRKDSLPYQEKSPWTPHMFILMETTCQSSNQSSSSNAFTLASLDTPLVAEKQTYPYISTGVPY